MLLAAALYAYAVLFPTGDGADKPSPYSPQFLHAAVIFYNLALTQVLSGAGADGSIILQSGRSPLPFGTIDIAVDQPSLNFASHTLTSFVPTMNLAVEGFNNDYRNDGIGAPLAAGLTPSPQTDVGLVIPDNLRIPTSAGPGDGRSAPGSLWATRSPGGSRSIRSTMPIPFASAIRNVPLEYDQTTARALFAVEGKGWTRELSGLLNNVLNDAPERSRRPRTICLRLSRTGTAGSRWCSSMAPHPARSAGRTWSMICCRISKFATISNSGSSPTTLAIRSRFRPTCCASRCLMRSNPWAACRPIPRWAGWWSSATARVAC